MKKVNLNPCLFVADPFVGKGDPIRRFICVSNILQKGGRAGVRLLRCLLFISVLRKLNSRRVLFAMRTRRGYIGAKGVSMKHDFKHQAENVKNKVKSMGTAKLVTLVVMAVATLVSFILHDFIFPADSVFNRGVSRSEFVNGLLALVPKIIQAVRIVTIILVITTVALYVVNGALRKNQRQITVARLINNMIKCVVAVITVIAVLAVWGIDTTALITGAGVLTLVVGLGMQSLISDVVAGLFIVFENEFNVGDIVTIDGFRGTVVSIGIRTTKLEALGNIKIVNNSDIRGVLNQTVKPSTAKALIDMEYGQSLERAERVIKENLPDVKIDGVLGAISYDGVAELGASGVTLQFTAECNENDIFAVRREMNKRLKIMFDENGIGIPFNQLVVHMADGASTGQ